MTRAWLQKIALVVLGGLLLVLLLGVGFVKCRYGRGQAYPDVSTAPLVPERALEQLVTLDFPPGNVAVSADGRVFFNYHPFAQARRFTDATVFELVDGAPRPFPDAAAQARFQGVFGMTVDRQQRLWFIEPAGLDHERTRLVAYDLRTGAEVFAYRFPPDQAEFAQDLRVSPDGGTVYLADTGLFQLTPASLIVFDVASSTYRTVLSGDASTQPQDWYIQTKHGPHRLAYGLVTFSVGVDGLELSPDGAWLYFATMTHDSLFKVPTEALRDPRLSAAELRKRIVRVGRKPLSDGITLDADGSVLVTDVEHGGIARMGATGELETLVKSSRVIWADGVVVAPDGSVIFTDSAIPAYIDQLARPPSRQRLRAAAPYHLYRFRP